MLALQFCRTSAPLMPLSFAEQEIRMAILTNGRKEMLGLSPGRSQGSLRELRHTLWSVALIFGLRESGRSHSVLAQCTRTTTIYHGCGEADNRTRGNLKHGRKSNVLHDSSSAAIH